jgi:hypothetical protein
MRRGHTRHPALSIRSLRNRTVGSARRIDRRGQRTEGDKRWPRDQREKVERKNPPRRWWWWCRLPGARTFERGADALDAFFVRHGGDRGALRRGFGGLADVSLGATAAAAAAVPLRHFRPRAVPLPLRRRLLRRGV